MINQEELLLLPIALGFSISIMFFIVTLLMVFYIGFWMISLMKLLLDNGDYCIPLYWLPRQSALDCFCISWIKTSYLKFHKLTSD